MGHFCSKRAPSIDPVAPPLASPSPSPVPPSSVIVRKGQAALRDPITQIALRSPTKGYWIIGVSVGIVAVLIVYIELRLRFV